MSRIAVIAAAAVIVAGGGVGAWLALSGGDDFAQCREGGAVVGAQIGGPFTLTSGDGARVTDADVIDRPTLVYFGYTHCPDFCPTDAANMAAVVDLLAGQGVSVNAAFITIDPARDTPETLGRFTAQMHPDMVGLSGSAEDVAAAAKAYRVYYAKAGDDPEFYLMDHSTFTYLMAPKVGFLDFFRHGEAPEAVAARVACYARALG
ncbi:MAG: SCO family protein [Alphaproteobacteria bacterium HGW-Alphaproteobacteria-8]|nr:MAG: SCO family protein [Alphaproteobacteria bacterium HGW-Alphaproteobacteria-8]